MVKQKHDYCKRWNKHIDTSHNSTFLKKFRKWIYKENVEIEIQMWCNIAKSIFFPEKIMSLVILGIFVLKISAVGF